MVDTPTDNSAVPSPEGVDRLGAVEQELSAVESLAAAEQVAAFARMHEVLAQELANTAPDRSVPGPGRPQGR